MREFRYDYFVSYSYNGMDHTNIVGNTIISRVGLIENINDIRSIEVEITIMVGWPVHLISFQVIKTWGVEA